MAENAAFLQVYDSLVAEHGCTSPAHLGICRSLAALLTDDSGDPIATARAVANLSELLPPKKPVGLVDRLIVELVPARPLRNENGSIRPWSQQDEAGQLAMIEQHCEGVPPEAIAAYEARQAAKVLHLVPAAPEGENPPSGPQVRGAFEALPGVPDPVAAVGPPLATATNPPLDPAREVLGETADERRARIISERRYLAGDRPMPLSQRSAFTESGMLSGEGRFPFDFPTRGGW